MSKQDLTPPDRKTMKLRTIKWVIRHISFALNLVNDDSGLIIVEDKMPKYVLITAAEYDRLRGLKSPETAEESDENTPINMG